MKPVSNIPVFNDLESLIQEKLRTEKYVDTAVKTMIEKALHLGSSDIILEPSGFGQTAVRFRIHGRFFPVTRLEPMDAERFVARLKVLAEIPVYITGKALEGRIDYDHNNRRAEIRMSSVPTICGERVALRIQDPDKNFLALDNLGFDSRTTGSIKDLLKLEQGLIIICGPTSSGKTTTLYAMLHHIFTHQNQTRQVIVIEDPVEFPMEGVPQIQVKEDSGFGFEEALKSILRQDPEVIGLGEIRDGSTARMAVRAALTGHLVLGTIHAGSIEEVPGRLRDLGSDRRLLAGALKAVLSQRLRLMKCLCRNGCDKCHGTGICGREPTGTLLDVTPEFREQILSREVPHAE